MKAKGRNIRNILQITKKIIGILTILASLTLALPALAQTTSTVLPSTTLTCIAAAVAARESALDTAYSTFSQSIQAAYSARASALAQAWTITNTKQRNAAIRAAWSAFNTAKRTANKTWITSRNSAWAQFRASVKTCKAPLSSTDSANSNSEVSGQ